MPMKIHNFNVFRCMEDFLLPWQNVFDAHTKIFSMNIFFFIAFCGSKASSLIFFNCLSCFRVYEKRLTIWIFLNHLKRSDHSGAHSTPWLANKKCNIACLKVKHTSLVVKWCLINVQFTSWPAHMRRFEKWNIENTENGSFFLLLGAGTKTDDI